MFSLVNCIACDCDKRGAGMRLTSMTMFFSSRVGVNSWPRVVNSSAAADNQHDRRADDRSPGARMIRQRRP